MLEQLFEAAISHGFSTGLLLLINIVLWRRLDEIEEQLYDCLRDRE